jgi:DNA-binding MarR family transcriptional regulator
MIGSCCRVRSQISCRSLDIMQSRGTISVTDVVMAKAIDPQSLLPLTPPVFQILLALCDRERHGYGIMQEVAAQTDGQLRLGPGTLYGCLNRMLRARLVEESEERPDPQLDDQRRRYYRITDLGRRVSRPSMRRAPSGCSRRSARHLPAPGDKEPALCVMRPCDWLAASTERCSVPIPRNSAPVLVWK